MTKEEVVASLGVDSGSVAQDLQTSMSEFQNFLGELKNLEHSQTDWFATELKKREEMEVESSVRAASRANQARRLLREREEARQVAEKAAQSEANVLIGQGSVPAGWAEQAAAKKAAIELEKKAAAALSDVEKGAHGSAGAFREVMVIIREGFRGDFTRMIGSTTRLLGMLGLSVSSLLGVFAIAAEAGAIAYQAIKLRGDVKEEEKSETRLNAGAERIAGRLKGEIANLEKAHKISHETAQKYDEILRHPTMERNRTVQDALRKLGGPVTKHDAAEELRLDEEHRKKMAQYAREDSNTSEKLIMDHFKILSLKGEMAKLDRTGVEYKQKQAELDEVQRDLLTDSKKQVEEEAEIKRKANEEQKVYDEAKIRMADLQQREREKFMPTLDELAHHGKFGREARAISRLERHIKREFEKGDTAGAQRDIGARNNLYDSLADRGVVAERSERREVKELTAKIQLHIAAIAEGKAAIKTIPALR
jgi:hypothetical protein